MQIILNNTIINIEIIRKANKNIYMRFLNTDTILVTCNHFISEREIKKILEKNKKSLEKMQLQKAKEKNEEKYFIYLGRKYQKKYDEISKIPQFQDDTIVIKDEKTLLRFKRKECERVFQMELDRILPFFPNIPSFSLRIRYMKTRWGVNNQGSKTITLNSELIKKDLDLIDYVIIHELCHFYEPNHSFNFWKHVAEYYPKYKEARKRLRS